MSYKIIVKSRRSHPSIDHIANVAKAHLKQRQAKPGLVEVELVSKQKIHEINRDHRNIDSPTDVLSFPSAEFPSVPKVYGTIFLCYDIIQLNARDSGKSFDEEFDFILKHGIDHLLGIHHK